MFGAPATGGFGGFGGFGAASQPSFGAASQSSFGAAPSSFAFGASQSQPAFGGFGAAASTPAFGQPQQQPQQQTTGLFGAAAPTTGFGGFGAAPSQPSAFGGQNTQQQTGAFGGGFGGFGQSQPALGGTNAFGSLPAQPAFGAATGSGFGFGGAAPAAQPSGFGGFGQQTQQPSLFGAASTPAFGQQQSQSSLFGSTPSQSTTTGLFGAAAPSPFGAAQTQSNLFGGTSTPAFGQAQPNTGAFGGGGLFGGASSSGMSTFGAAPATTTTFGGFAGGFGQQQQQQQQQQPGQSGVQGSRIKRFEPTTERTALAGGKDNIVVYQTITAMPEYLNKSLEEIRWEDMQLAGDQPLSSNVPISNAPSQPANTGFAGFGSAAAPSTGLFGQPAAQPSLFGAQQPQTTSFGVSSSQPSLFSGAATNTFGAASQPAFSFGQTAASTSTFGTGGAFGAAQSTFGGGGNLFGQTQSTFGQSQPATGGLFGAAPAAQSTSSLFGGNTGGSLFGGQTGSSLFGGNTGAAQTGGLFGATTSTPSSFAFPPATGSSLFSQPAAPTTGLFGQQQSQNSLFGNSFAAPAATGSLFGTGMFGQTQQQPSQNPFGFGQLPQQQQQQQQQQFAPQQATQIAKVDDNPFLTNFVTTSSAQLARNSASFPAPANPPSNLVSGSPSNFLTIAPRLSMGRSAARQSGIRRTNAYSGSPASNLIPSMTMTPTRSSPHSTALITLSTPNKQSQNSMSTPNSSLQNQSIVPQSITADLLVSRRNARKLTDIAVPVAIELPVSASKNNRLHEESKESVYEEEKREPQSIKRNDYVQSETPILNNPDYFTSPSMSELAQMSPQSLSAVKNFSVHHSKYGSVEWLEPVDVRNLQLDRLVQFSSSGGASSVEVDPTLDPVRGATLNHPAIVTLKECWPQSSSQDPSKASARLKRYEMKLKEASERAGAQFISYDPLPGEWKFKVEQFA